MRLIALTLTLALASGTVASGTVATAAPAAGAQATVTRLVLYKGGGDATPAGPAVQPPGVNTVSTAPKTITTSNDGTLEEDPGLTAPGVTHGGEWWYHPLPNSYVELHVFYWQRPGGTKVKAQNLVPALANDSEWLNLGHGVYTPKCLSWVPYGTMNLQYIRITSGHTWVKVSAAGLAEYC